MKIYVGNLNYKTTHQAIQDLFSQHGQVDEVYIPTDRETGRVRGFAFVTMPNDEEGTAAVAATNNQELDGRTLRVNEARPRDDAGGAGGGGGRGGRR